MRKAHRNIISDLAEFHYLTVAQLMTLEEYKESSRSYFYKAVNELVAEELIMALPRQVVTQPRLYTLTAKGRRLATMLGTVPYKRYRLGEEQERGENALFVLHTIAVTDVLIAARLLAKTVPGIRLNRMLTERALQRTMYVPVSGEGTTQRRICIEPDGALDFSVNNTFQDFIFIEVYRHHLNEERFQRKIKGYVTALISGLHQQVFHTDAMTVAIIATTDKLKETLNQWAAEALLAMERQDAGERFFFCSLNTATTSPEELFLSPVWEHAFSTDKTPLIVLE
jgi:Replication-relaxation